MSGFLYGQYDYSFDKELIKSKKVLLVEAKLTSYRKDKIDTINSNISFQEFDKNGNIIKKTFYDYSKDYITMYDIYDYDSKCLKVSNYEVFAIDDFINYYSLISNKTFYSKNCKIDSIQNYHLENLESTDFYKYKNEDIESILSIENNNNFEETFYKNANKFERETIFVVNGKIEAKYIDKLDKHKNVTEFCDLVDEEKVCGKYEYVYNRNKIIKESYFNQSKKLDHVLELEYLDNGLLNKKTTYLTDENGKLILSSIVNYNYQYY